MSLFDQILNLRGVVDDARPRTELCSGTAVRTYFAHPKLYAEEGWKTATTRLFIPSLSLNFAKIN